MIDFQAFNRTLHNSREIAKIRFLALRVRQSRWLLSFLFLSASALTACSYSHQTHLQPGAADYRHFPDGGGLFVSAAFGPDGRLWRVVPEKHHVYVDSSADLGKTFSEPVLVNKESQHIKVSGENRPGIAVDRDGRITIIYAAEGTQPVAMYFSVSTDNGRSFSTPSPVSDKAAEANSFQGRLLLSPSDQTYVYWHDERDRTDWRQAGNSIYYATINALNNQGLVARKLSDSICECCHIAAAFDKGGQPVVLARFIYPGGIRDHGLLWTQNNGTETFSRRATYDEWHIEACPEHGPAIAISDNNRYHIAWFTQGSARQGLFYAYSSDRGEHFAKPLQIGDPERLPSHPDISAHGKYVALTWTEFDGIKTQLKIMKSIDGGLNWSKAKSIAEAAAETDFPFFLSNSTGTFVSWNSKTEGYRLIPVR